MATDFLKSGYVLTSDGIRLHYLEAGSGPPLVMIPGWSQSAEQFKYQIEGLSSGYRVLALDMRGHGESDKPPFGYKISRLAKDLHDVFLALGIREAALLGHSMGASVTWSYWDLFGADRLCKLILVDQQAVLLRDPAWVGEEEAAVGATFTTKSLFQMCHELVSGNGEEVTKKFLDTMVSSAMSSDKKNWILERNLRFPRREAAALLYNHVTQDWRDVIPRISLPTLVVGGRISVVPWQSQVWIHDHIVGSRLEIFEEEERGNHFMFIEAPEKFNRLLKEFLA
jgi:non-heme chloroperoxidase